MSRKELEIELKDDEVAHLEEFVKKGRRSARELTRARVLLLVHEGKRTETIADMLGIHRGTIWRIKERYLEGGLERALHDNPRSGQPKTYTERHEAEIIALACTRAPEGRKRMTLELMAQELRTREGFEKISRETIRLVLKKAKRGLG